MALRVARGLFRLWLVLSALWVGGVDVVTWREYPAALARVYWLKSGRSLLPET